MKIVPISRPTKFQSGEINDFELGILTSFSIGLNPKTILEIGTFRGTTSTVLARALPEAKIVTVNLPIGENPKFGVTEFDPNFFPKEELTFPEDVVNRIYQVHIDSANLEQIQLPIKWFDMAFIDGCHSREYVRNDFEKALHLMKFGGVIVFHDYPTWPTVKQEIDILKEEYNMYDWYRIDKTSFVFCKLEGKAAGAL